MPIDRSIHRDLSTAIYPRINLYTFLLPESASVLLEDFLIQQALQPKPCGQMPASGMADHSNWQLVHLQLTGFRAPQPVPWISELRAHALKLTHGQLENFQSNLHKYAQT